MLLVLKPFYLRRTRLSDVRALRIQVSSPLWAPLPAHLGERAKEGVRWGRDSGLVEMGNFELTMGDWCRADVVWIVLGVEPMLVGWC